MAAPKGRIASVAGFLVALTMIGLSMIPSSLQNASAIGCTNWKGLPDRDCDGLADEWEVAQAYDSTSDSDSLTVPLLGANWQHKDLFVELDYMSNTGFSHTAVQHVIDAFAGANVWNPGGELGITLHVTEDTRSSAWM